MSNNFFDPKNTKKSLPIALLRVREGLMSRFRPVLMKHGITEQQWRIVRVLAEQKELEVSQLAERAHILGPSLSRILKNLERDALIQKRKDEKDGRVFWLGLTDKGLSLIRSVQPDSEEIYTRLVSTLGAKRVENLLEQLNEVAELIETDV